MADRIESNLAVLPQLIEAICEMHPEQAHKVDLDHVGLITACRTASESGEGDAPRRSSSGCAADFSHAEACWCVDDPEEKGNAAVTEPASAVMMQSVKQHISMAT